jgi:hypothetical protein
MENEFAGKHNGEPQQPAGQSEVQEVKVRRANNGAPLRSLDGAIQMYQSGMKIAQIAHALGYATRANGKTVAGTKRIARFLEAAGVRAKK